MSPERRPRFPMALPDTLEGEVQARILRYLTLRGIEAWRTNSGVFRRGGRRIRGAPAGTPDIIGYVKDARFLAVECKRERGTIEERKLQVLFIERLNAKGGIGIFAR